MMVMKTLNQTKMCFCFNDFVSLTLMNVATVQSLPVLFFLITRELRFATNWNLIRSGFKGEKQVLGSSEKSEEV